MQICFKMEYACILCKIPLYQTKSTMNEQFEKECYMLKIKEMACVPGKTPMFCLQLLSFGCLQLSTTFNPSSHAAPLVATNLIFSYEFVSLFLIIMNLQHYVSFWYITFNISIHKFLILILSNLQCFPFMVTTSMLYKNHCLPQREGQSLLKAL